MVYRLSPERRQVKAEEGQSCLLSLPNSLAPRAARFPDYVSHDLSASPPGLQKHNGSSTYEVSNFSWIALKETSWSNSALRTFNSIENILLMLCAQIQATRGMRAQSCWLFPQLLCASYHNSILVCRMVAWLKSSLALPSLQAQVQLEQLYLSRSTVCCPLDLSVKCPIHCCLSCVRLFM